MKKLAFSLIACLALVQSTYAATSPLTESLLEYEAITTAIGTDPTFQNIIGTSEFIVDIKRITRKVNTLGIVKYFIKTRVISSEGDVNASTEGLDMNSDESPASSPSYRTNLYIATLNVALNPGIGPNVITVLRIKKVCNQAYTFFDTDFSNATEE